VVPVSCLDLLFEPGDGADLLRALEMFCAEPARFAVTPSQVDGWDTHVSGVERAYRDAMARVMAAPLVDGGVGRP
jgi:hypothetical protein